MSNWLSHDSFVGHLGGYVDKALNPISWATHGKWTHFTSDVLPKKVNAGLSAVMQPFDWVDQKINPVRKIPIVNRVSNIVKAKPGDAAAIAAGAYFGGSALLGGGGAGGVGAGGAGGLGAGGAGEAGFGSLGTTSGFGGVGVDGGVAGLGTEGLGGTGVVGAGTADVGGLAAADSAAVDAEGAAPGLTEGYGPASESGAASSSTTKQSMPQQQQQEERKKQLDQMAVMRLPTYEERRDALLVDSSRALKTAPGLVTMSDVARQGASGADRISENGVHIGAIRALHTKIGRLEAIAKQRGITV